MLKDSYSAPCRAAPSPNIQTARLSVPLYFSANAIPVPMGIWAPTIPLPPKYRCFLEKKCIDPPFPFVHPVFLPHNSPIHSPADIPPATATPCLRYPLTTAPSHLSTL